MTNVPPMGGTNPYQPAQPPYPSPASGDVEASNGMAVAALVLGIVTWFCLGPLGGVLAVVFGILGLSRAKKVGKGSGMSIAGIVLGLLGSVVSVILLFAFVIGANKAADDVAKNISGVADPSSYELHPDDSSCTADEFGAINYSGTIKNKTSTDKNFTIKVELRNSTNDQVIDTPVDIVTNLQPGSSAAWHAVAYEPSVSKVSCKVVAVENWFN